MTDQELRTAVQSLLASGGQSDDITRVFYEELRKKRRAETVAGAPTFQIAVAKWDALKAFLALPGGGDDIADAWRDVRTAILADDQQAFFPALAGLYRTCRRLLPHLERVP